MEIVGLEVAYPVTEIGLVLNKALGGAGCGARAGGEEAQGEGRRCAISRREWVKRVRAVGGGGAGGGGGGAAEKGEEVVVAPHGGGGRLGFKGGRRKMEGFSQRFMFQPIFLELFQPCDGGSLRACSFL